ncbi:MAG: hypothetical protein ACLVJH_17735 [Faecalibacterium prausnitzii]
MSLEVNITKKPGWLYPPRPTLHARSTATAILGASGCGKSMTLRCIAGIVKAGLRGASYWTAGCCSTAPSASTCRRSRRGVGLPVPELRPVPQHDRGAEYALRPESRKDRPPARHALRRDAAGHAAGAWLKRLPGPAFRRAAAAHRPGTHPGQAGPTF